MALSPALAHSLKKEAALSRLFLLIPRDLVFLTRFVFKYSMFYLCEYSKPGHSRRHVRRTGERGTEEKTSGMRLLGTSVVSARASIVKVDSVVEGIGINRITSNLEWGLNNIDSAIR